MLPSLQADTKCCQAGRTAELPFTKHLSTRKAIWGSFQGVPSQLQPPFPRSPCSPPGARQGKGSNGARSRNAWRAMTSSPPSHVLCIGPHCRKMAPLHPSDGVNQDSQSTCVCASEPVQSSRPTSSSKLRVCFKGGKHTWVIAIACRGDGV